MGARMKPRALLALLALAPSAVACQVIWSYDDFKDAPNATTSSSGTSSSSSGTSSSTSSSSSSSTSSSSGGCVDAGSPCDCDGDGDNAATPECDGGDCDDNDPLVSSKQTMWFNEAGSNGWDYNCSNNIEFEYTGPIQCPALVPCTTPPQYLDAPPSCGEVGPYANCVTKGIGCGPSNQLGLLTQNCH